MPCGALATSAVGLAYATTDGRAPTLLDRWGGPDTTGARLVRDAIARAASGDTNRLGQLLAVLGIRYVVVADHLVPAPLRGEVRPVPPVIGRTFGAQLDLERVESVNEAVTVYRNNSWVPIRAVLANGTDFTADPLAGTRRLTDRTNAIPALVATSPDGIRATGPLAAGARLYLATNASTNWRLRVAGGDVARSDAFGWANVFEPATAAMTESVTKVKEAVENTAEAVQSTMTKVTETFDLATHVRNYPWRMIGAGVATGFVLGQFIKAGASKAPVATSPTSPAAPLPSKAEAFRSNGREHTRGPLSKLATEVQGLLISSLSPVLQSLFGAALGEFFRQTNSSPSATPNGLGNVARHGREDTDHDWAEPEMKREPDWGGRLRAAPK